MQQVLDFLKALAANNNREWFAAHKDEYLEVKEEVENFTARLLEGTALFDPDARRLRPEDCLYRIYRDTRFSHDKTPYKTHIGIYVNPPFGKKSPTAGYYIHLEPGNCLVGGGAWAPEAPVLKRIRKDIFENAEEYMEIISNPEFSRYDKEVGEECLKTAPKGFPKDWEHIDLLKPRWFTIETPLTDRQVTARNAASIILDRMKAQKPFLDFLNYAIRGEEEDDYQN